MWRAARPTWRRGARRLSSTVRRHLEDEGHWFYSPEWWGSDAGGDGDTVFRSVSDHGNGLVSVVSYPSSKPAPEQWPVVEKWLQERYAKLHPEFPNNGKFKILGYQWRVLRFNDNTRQSTAKIMASYRKSEPASLYLMQQPHCLAVPYLKSMVSAGLTALASCGYDLFGAVSRKRTMNVLCIGHGGGSLPLFLASKIKGATIHIVEIDPAVISASIQAMGFPASAVKETLDQLPSQQSTNAEQFFWEGIHDRLFLHRSDAEDFILNATSTYDLVLIDAYDGDDIFPHKLWDSNGVFLDALKRRLHPVHGIVVVNLHADAELLETGLTDDSVSPSILPMGKYISQVCKAYKEHMGLAYVLSVPWLCNLTLVACNGGGLANAKPGFSFKRDLVQNALISNSGLVEAILELPFPCLQYIKRGFVLVD